MNESTQAHDKATTKTLSCETCCADLPEATAMSAEVDDYVLHFCGSECFARWKEKVPAEAKETISFPLSISQLAEAAHTTVHTVRSYLADGLIECADHTDAGYRLFDRCALDRLRLIRSAREAGLMLLDIKPLV